MSIAYIQKMTGRNIPAGCRFDYALHSAIDTYPELEESTYSIPDEITLDVGASWGRIDFNALNLLHFTEVPDYSQGDPFIITELRGPIPKDRFDIIATLQKLHAQRYVVKYHNLNGDVLVIGSPDEPAMIRLEKRDHGSDQSGKNEYEVVVRCRSRIPAPFYDENGTYEDPCADGGGGPDTLNVVYNMAADDSEVEYTITANEAGDVASHSDDGGSGTVSWQIDTGGGYGTATPPYTQAVGDKIKVTRTTTSSAGWAKQTGTT